MNNLLSRRFFLTAAASASLGHVAFANAPLSSARPVARGGKAVATVQQVRAPSTPKALIEAAKLGGTFGFAVADLRTGKLLETGNAALGLPPASTAKAITALYSLDALGPNYRFSTQIKTNGSIAGGVVSGDLFLIGSGDPTLDTNALFDMASKLKALGIREVRGQFYYVDNALPNLRDIDKTQPEHVSYNPAVSGLNLNYNRVHFEWRRGSNGYQVTMDARSDKHRPNVYISKMQIAARKLPVYSYKDGGAFDQWSVASGALGKSGSRWLPVRKPGLYAADVFQTFARAQGIVLKSPKRNTRRPKSRAIVTHTSPPLSKILRDMLKFSTNLTAEVVGLTATRKRGGRATTLKASANEMSRWANTALKMGNASFADHSGLSASSKVSAQGMVNSMLVARRRAGFAELLKPIAMRDAKRKVIKNHPIKVNAKTGTLNFVSALSGYMTAADGKQMAFAMICANTDLRRGLKGAEKEAPSGGQAWNRRAKALQQQLIERWGAVYG
ncbi:D-alanyl-D-alanine carboxypeptidase/D-alanyl-D-alanine-endopeptidase [Planktotalea sp.]|uniref:D-alanyl-D-alanine carboxypeptidase/D-alanyl-D-alanine endopeptidase n=1 Tax=Planktotalea sp. TaxID=2029877 RepID=UPI0025FD4A62|nr:D-alanyl-D-alanine carboxypeptidase/D-alanyl-D-alanine-endopeptidase [Planktotalea sp.]